MALYSMRTLPNGTLRITKFDADLNPLNSYIMDKTCTCPQAVNRNAWCRHMDILAAFAGWDRINSGWLYDYDTNTWKEPIDGSHQ